MFFLALYRNKKFTSALAVLSTFVLGTAVGVASPQRSPLGVSYKTSLGLDLDGDHIPETATVRQHGSFYQVSIHFSTGRPKLRLRTYLGDDVGGLTLQVTDMNSDSEADIVLTSATSVRPVAVWLNHGNTNFRRVSARTYRLAFRYSGPRMKQQVRVQRDSISGVSNDKLSQAEPGVLLNTYTGLESVVLQESDPLTFDSWLAQVAWRGPPFSPHI